MRRLPLAALALALAAWRLPAQQVGHDPDRSPFVDVESRQTLTLFSGHLGAGADPAGVSPGSAPLLGARYDWTIASAGAFYVRGVTALSSRTPINPLLASGAQSLGRRSWPVSFFDTGFSLALTGNKSWHRLVPSASLGLGFMSDFILGDDIGGYSVGTNFLVSYGAAVRYIVTDTWSVRVELTDFLHRYKYPDSYFQGTAPVLTDTKVRSGWRHNSGLQIGLQRAMFR